MSNVPKSRRKETKFEAQHQFIKLRQEVTSLMLNNFGFSLEKAEKDLERFRKSHSKLENIDVIVEAKRIKLQGFADWFIDKEKDAVISMLRRIDAEFTFGNSIYPSETPAKVAEFCERRKHINNAIAYCFILKQEINYIIRSLPVDINKFQRFDDMINRQVALYKGVRSADNRFLKSKSKWKSKSKDNKESENADNKESDIKSNDSKNQDDKID